jgi:adenosylmethionine-8-amino-7-oxononanoate aminotransferase
MPAFPQGSVLYRRLDREFPVATSASGCWITDATGRRYLDGAGGAMVANLGHGRAELAAAVAEAIGSLGYLNGTQFTHRFVEKLAAELTTWLPAHLRHCYFLSSGSEAIEAAVKLARQYWVERGEERRTKILSRVPSYHGNTLTALSLSGREHYRRIYGPLLTSFPRFPAPDPYRDPDGPGATGDAFEEELQRQGPETVAAVVIEPIGGSSSGAVVPDAAYLARLARRCGQHGILLIADEVLTGAGRTGRFLAGDHFGLQPDILVLGKGLNGGAVPLSAVVASREIVDTLARGSGAFNHAQTYSHTPAICAAGLATLRILRRERLVERVASLEKHFLGELQVLRESPWVGDIRGKGLLAAVELVRDRATKEPCPRAHRIAERITAAAFTEGLVVWPNVGHANGVDGDLLMLAPPFVVSAEEIGQMVTRLRRALAAVSPG